MRKAYYLSLISLFIMLGGCTTSEPPKQVSHQNNDRWQPGEEQHQANDPLSDVFQQWQGVSYRLGGSSKAGIDCSAFVQIAFQEAWQQTLPRTTLQQSQQGKSISYYNARYGDLVFFKTSRSTRHVGIYLGDQQFMHASTSQGVMVSRVDNPYWASKLWQFRRIETQPLMMN